ncbi:MAG: 50S ribosomal protein L9 [Candidatus Binatia bacterium]|jgi:large subunit ribosomal protein L9
MKVILREDVPDLGSVGDIVKVKPGFARNYLLPRGLALVADKRNIRVLEHQKRVVADKRERDRKRAQGAAERLSNLRLTIKARAGEEGKLFGSVTNLDIERALATQGFSIERRRIRIEEPIKSIGEHTVPIHLGVGIDAKITVIVEAEA